ncbi:MAG: methyltransferase domain-containing protein [Pelobium sp.]
MLDIYGSFLKDFYLNKLKGEVLLHNNYGEAEELPVTSFFRAEEDMPDVEIFALNLCVGKILDIGAGTGCHSTILQRNGFDVTAIELSVGACELMKIRGVQKIVNQDVMGYPEMGYDTLLLMMNGIGFCGYIEDLKLFLHHAKNLVKPDGQILFDSSDVSYLYEDDLPETDSYYGEIDYQYEYNDEKGEWFSWLYIDEDLMRTIAAECGWKLQVIYQDEDDHYLGRLTLIN